MSETPPYDKGIVASLQWNLDNDQPLQQVLCDNNFCNSGYKCYYGGVVPVGVKPIDAAHNFVISVMSLISQPTKSNKPIVTKINTDSFFIILSDIKNENNVNLSFFFYDGVDAIKNLGKRKLSIKEFSIAEIEKAYRKPWAKINLDKINGMSQKMEIIFKELAKRINEKHTEHSDNCGCGENHDTAECTGNIETSE